MQFDILTIFPHIFDSYFNESILKRAREREIVQICVHNLRDFTQDKHQTTDDLSYGGGPGMVMKAEPIYRALKQILSQRIGYSSLKPQKTNFASRIILFSARGEPFAQKKAMELSKFKRLFLICGHYEGVDERVTHFVDEVISIGPYVLTGGELPAMVLVDSITRLLPGVLGNEESLTEESFSPQGLEYPQYTRPADFHGLKVPPVLLSGDHQKIKAWRQKNKN